MRSLHGKGSVFSIEVPLAQDSVASTPDHPLPHVNDALARRTPHTGDILIIEDDPEVREHLKLFLTEEGYNIATAIDGPAALELLAQGTLLPDLVLADYNLLNGMSEDKTSQKLRQELNRNLPFVILTGDISTKALRDIALLTAFSSTSPLS